MGYLEKYRIFVPELRRSFHIAKYRNDQKSARFHIVTYIIQANAQLLDFQSKSELERVRIVNDISLSERGTTTHVISCNMPSDTLLKVIAISSMNQELYNDDENGNPLDEVWTIGLTADNSMENGDYIVTMPADGLIFNMRQNGTYVSSRIKEDVTCVFTITGGTITAVKQVKADKETGDLYDLSGRRINKPLNHGIYINGGKKVAK